MLLTYLYHSCFAVEGDGYTILFDYFDFPGHINLEATIKRLIHKEGKLYILSSHHHPDHFSSSALQWKEERPDIHFIFSRDILDKKLTTPDDAFYLRKGESYNDGVINVEAFGSTDIGISFLLTIENKHIFHAGDLNNWHWNEESTTHEIQKAESDFRKEIQQIRTKTGHIFLTMFPVDPRLGKDYMKGAEEFVTRVKCDIFAPMHAWERYNEANRFKIFAAAKGIRFLSIHSPGECFKL